MIFGLCITFGVTILRGTNEDDMTHSAMLKMADVIEMTTLSRSEIYRRIAAGTFPKQRNLSPRRVVWSKDEVERWINDQLGAAA